MPDTQIEFIKSAFSGISVNPVVLGNLVAAINVSPDLMHRRIYAWVGQPGAPTGDCTYTITFKLGGAGGVVVGTIAQRIFRGGPSSTTVNGDWYGFGWNIADGAVASYGNQYQRTPDCLTALIQNTVSTMYGISIPPLRARLQIDRIEITCSEFTTNTAGTPAHVFLACLSSRMRE